jgi:hypothetical protein
MESITRLTIPPSGVKHSFRSGLLIVAHQSHKMAKEKRMLVQSSVLASWPILVRELSFLVAEKITARTIAPRRSRFNQKPGRQMK